MRLFVPLTRDELDRLREVARVERRRPQEQAAVLLAQALAADVPELPTSLEGQSSQSQTAPRHEGVAA